MKKFYESPIVELTVFDAEDVITTSAVVIDTAATGANLEALVSGIQTAAYGNVEKVEAYNSSYNW